MQSRDRYTIALLSAFAVALHGIEGLIPAPVPWLRFGFANLITLVALLRFGFRAAFSVTLIRVILASMLNGSFPGPGFVLSLGGGVTSTLSMGLVFAMLPKIFSPFGLSIIGAFFHNSAQLVLAYFLFIGRLEPVLLISPVIIFIGIITGAINGIVAGMVMKELEKKDRRDADKNGIISK
jgi:heptaprenyl diphosphate synthase